MAQASTEQQPEPSPKKQPEQKQPESEKPESEKPTLETPSKGGGEAAGRREMKVWVLTFVVADGSTRVRVFSTEAKAQTWGNEELGELGNLTWWIDEMEVDLPEDP